MWQITDVINNYFNYPTEFKIEFDTFDTREVPAFSFCYTNFENVSESINKMKCSLTDKTKTTNSNCFLTPPIYNNLNKKYCFTLYSTLATKKEQKMLFDPNNYSINNKIVETISYYFDNLDAIYLSIHGSKTPFTVIKKFILLTKLDDFKLTVINQKLLPSPFDTSCFDYSVGKARSKGECKSNCFSKHQGKTQYKTELYNVYNRSQKLIESSSHFLKRQKQCYEKCKKDCISQFYNLHSVTSARSSKQATKLLKRMGLSSHLQVIRDKKELLLTYLEALTIGLVFAQIGSSLSFWFGLSIFDLFQVTKKLNYRKIKFMIKIFKFFATTICLSFCILQSLDLIQSYFRFETATDVQVFLLPNLKVLPVSVLLFVNKMKTTSNYETTNYAKYANKTKFEIKQKMIFSNDYKQQYEIRPIFNRENITEVSYEISTNFSKHHLFALMLLGTSYTVTFESSAQIGDKLNVFLNLQTVKNLNSPWSDCFNYIESPYPNHLTGHALCRYKCFQKTLKTRFNCIDENQILKYIRLPKLDHCKHLKNVSEVYNYLVDNCKKECKKPCFQFEYNVRSFLTITNHSSLEFNFGFDYTQPFIQYNSIPKMSSFDFFYELGGTLSLWFGFTLCDLLKCYEIIVKGFWDWMSHDQF